MVSSEYVCSSSAYVFGMGMSRASAPYFALVFRDIPPVPQGTSGFGNVRGAPRYGMYHDWIVVLDSCHSGKSGTEAAVDCKKEAKDMDP